MTAEPTSSVCRRLDPMVENDLFTHLRLNFYSASALLASGYCEHLIEVCSVMLMWRGCYRGCTAMMRRAVINTVFTSLVDLITGVVTATVMSCRVSLFYHVLRLYNFPAESCGTFLSEHYVALSLDSLPKELYVKMWHGHEHMFVIPGALCRHRHADT